MKKLLFLLAIAALTSNFQCSRAKSFELNRPFELRYLQEAYNSESDLKILFSSIPEDSRCPRNTSCVWEGRAVIDLTLTGKRDTTLSLTDQAGKPELAKVTYDGLLFRLITVRPYPVADQQIPTDAYSVELEVSRP